MFRIWAKLMKNDKIVKEYMFTSNEHYQTDKFFNYLMLICKELDIETPIALSKHINHFEEFNNSKFLEDDFIDTINFDCFILENVPN